MAPAILEEELPTVGEARSEGGFAEVESPKAVDDGDDGNRPLVCVRAYIAIDFFVDTFDNSVFFWTVW